MCGRRGLDKGTDRGEGCEDEGRGDRVANVDRGPSLIGYAKLKMIAATASAITSTPETQATLAAVRSVTLGPLVESCPHALLDCAGLGDTTSPKHPTSAFRNRSGRRCSGP